MSVERGTCFRRRIDIQRPKDHFRCSRWNVARAAALDRYPTADGAFSLLLVIRSTIKYISILKTGDLDLGVVKLSELLLPAGFWSFGLDTRSSFVDLSLKMVFIVLRAYVISC